MNVRFLAKRMGKSLMKIENMGECWCLKCEWKTEFEIYSTICWDTNSYYIPKDKVLVQCHLCLIQVYDNDNNANLSQRIKT